MRPHRGQWLRTFAAMSLAALLAACGGSSGDNGTRPAAGGSTGVARSPSADGSSTIGASNPGVVGQSAPRAAVCGTADLSGASSFVYVSSAGTDGRGCGSTTATACKSIAYGIDSCAAEGCAVLVRHGLYPTSATIVLKNAVSVYGSCRFDGEVDRRYRTTIQASPAPGTPAVSANGIDAPTAFSGIVVIAKDETANGTASIGMVVNNSKGLSLNQNTLLGGRGGHGATGALVAATPGSTGSDATVTVTPTAWSGAGGAGAPACVYAGRSAGAGGVGANQNTVYSYGCFITCGCNNTGGTNGVSGRPGGSDVLGGGGGGVGPNGPNCSPGSTATNGGTGGPGTPGACSQAPGVADANPWGEFKATAWQPGVGGGGNLGDWGAGGGGGGAGSVCTHTNFTQADFFGYPGGGGGSGGCGGPGGTGGQQGGASIALVLASSSVTVDPGALAIVPGQGGTGGQGGPGSTGGAGGKGGRDGSVSYYPELANCTVAVAGGNESGLGYPGGPGGVGGQGGGGSGAAGGNGGPSIGIGLSGNAAAPSSVTGIYLGLPGGGGAQGDGGAGAKCTGVAGSVGAGGGTGPLVNLDKPAPSVLTSGQALVQGQSRASANGAYTLLLQTDGNLCLKTLPALNYVWCSLQNNLGSADRVAMQTDGNLCLSTGGNTTKCSNTASHPGAYLTVRDDGRAVIYEGSTVLWSVP